MAILNNGSIDEFNNNSSTHIQTSIEKFTNTASELATDPFIRLYLNMAKYEPLKGSFYIPLLKALTTKKAVINV